MHISIRTPKPGGKTERVASSEPDGPTVKSRIND